MTSSTLHLADVDSFVNFYVDSFTDWDILTLYGSSPHNLSPVEDIAMEVGRSEDVVESCLTSLAEKGFFVVERSPGGTRYRWRPDGELAASVERFVNATADRRGRLKALSVLLRKLGPSSSTD